MKIIKPDAVTVLHRTFAMSGQHFLVATAILAFDLLTPGELSEEAGLWEAAIAMLGDDLALDAGFPKPAAEVLLLGTCYPARGQAPAGQVRLAMGNVDKTLYVFGDRAWSHGSGSGPPEPQPFPRMPLDWAHAFGGHGFAKNPRGRGLGPMLTRDGHLWHPLPNLEHPAHLITSPAQRPDPVGFGPLPPGWPQRRLHSGTYDDAWLKTQWPHFPLDVDFRFFNTAPEDQWLSERPRGDESFVVEGALPEGKALHGRLPGRKVRFFVTRERAGKEDFSEISLYIDTLWIFPDHGVGGVAFRGVFPVDDSKGSELRHAYVAIDPLGKPVFLPIHYQHFLASLAPAAAEQEPTPEQEPEPASASSSEASEPTPAPAAVAPEQEQASIEAGQALAAAEQKLVDELARLGIPLDSSWLHAATSPPPVQDLAAAESLLEKSLAEAGVDFGLYKALSAPELPAAEAEALIRKALAGTGLDAGMFSMSPRDVFSHSFDARKIIEELRPGGIITPELESSLLELEKEFAQCKAFASANPEAFQAVLGRAGAAAPESAEEQPARAGSADWNRERVEEALSVGQCVFAGQDFSGLDLSALNLRGADLRGALLRGCDLSRARLDQADLRDADMGGAKLVAAHVQGANCSGATLSEAVLEKAVFAGSRFDEALLLLVKAEGADFHGASLRNAVLQHGDFSQASFQEADLRNALCTQARFRSASLDKAVMENADFRQAGLSEARLTGARARDCDLSEADLSGACCREANLCGAYLDGARLDKTDLSRIRATSLSLLGAKGTDTIFQEAELENLRADAGTVLLKADFSHALLRNAYLGGSDLRGALCHAAMLDDSTFQNCRLAMVSFTRASARGTRFMGCDLSDARLVETNLFHGSLAESLCRRTDFQGANLFEVDTMGTVFQDVRLHKALTTRTRIQEERKA